MAHLLGLSTEILITVFKYFAQHDDQLSFACINQHTHCLFSAAIRRDRQELGLLVALQALRDLIATACSVKRIGQAHMADYEFILDDSLEEMREAILNIQGNIEELRVF